MKDFQEALHSLADEFHQLSEAFTVFGDETRQQIFTTLIRAGCSGLRVGEISKQTHLSRPAVSHHLKILKDAKLIKIDKLGTMNFYHVDTERTIIKKMQTLFNHMDMLITDFEEGTQ